MMLSAEISRYFFLLPAMMGALEYRGPDRYFNPIIRYILTDPVLALLKKHLVAHQELIKIMAERGDGGLGPSAIGLWDYGFGLREVLTFSPRIEEQNMIEILDVDASTGLITPESGCECVVLDGLKGWKGASFTTFTARQLPALLYLYDEDLRNVEYSIHECNLEALLAGSKSCYRTVNQGINNPKRTVIGVDSAD